MAPPSLPTLDKSLTLEQQCESLNYEIEMKNEKISKLQTSLNQKTLMLDEAHGKHLQNSILRKISTLEFFCKFFKISKFKILEGFCLKFSNSEKHEQLMKEVNKIEEKNYKISCLNDEIKDLKISLDQRSSEIDQLKTDLFENSRRSDISITMASS